MEKVAVNIGDQFLGPGHPLTSTEGIGALVSNIVQLGLTIAGIILLFLLVGGGLAMVIGAGNDNPEQAAKGRQAATSAVIGFLVVFAAYWIVRLIELITGITILGG